MRRYIRRMPQRGRDMKRCENSAYNPVAMCNVCDYTCKPCAGYRRKCKVKDEQDGSVAKVV